MTSTTYDDSYSIEIDRPPVSEGTYGVLLQDQLTKTTATWANGAWDKEGVVRYSGDIVRVPLERQQELASSILAGTGLKHSKADAFLLQPSQSAALELARHFASISERGGLAEDRARARRRNALGCYGVAKGLGVTFDKFKASVTPASHEATDTDRALIEAYSAELPGIFLAAAGMIEAPEGQRSLEEWAGNLLADRTAKVAKKTAKAAKKGAVATV